MIKATLNWSIVAFRLTHYLYSHTTKKIIIDQAHKTWKVETKAIFFQIARAQSFPQVISINQKSVKCKFRLLNLIIVY